jgi:hypothetical protein
VNCLRSRSILGHCGLAASRRFAITRTSTHLDVARAIGRTTRNFYRIKRRHRADRTSESRNDCVALIVDELRRRLIGSFRREENT